MSSSETAKLLMAMDSIHRRQRELIETSSSLTPLFNCTRNNSPSSPPPLVTISQLLDTGSRRRRKRYEPTPLHVVQQASFTPQPSYLPAVASSYADLMKDVGKRMAPYVTKRSSNLSSGVPKLPLLHGQSLTRTESEEPKRFTSAGSVSDMGLGGRHASKSTSNLSQSDSVVLPRLERRSSALRAEIMLEHHQERANRGEISSPARVNRRGSAHMLLGQIQRGSEAKSEKTHKTTVKVSKWIEDEERRLRVMEKVADGDLVDKTIQAPRRGSLLAFQLRKSELLRAEDHEVQARRSSVIAFSALSSLVNQASFVDGGSSIQSDSDNSDNETAEVEGVAAAVVELPTGEREAQVQPGGGSGVIRRSSTRRFGSRSLQVGLEQHVVVPRPDDVDSDIPPALVPNVRHPSLLRRAPSSSISSPLVELRSDRAVGTTASVGEEVGGDVVVPVPPAGPPGNNVEADTVVKSQVEVKPSGDVKPSEDLAGELTAGEEAAILEASDAEVAPVPAFIPPATPPSFIGRRQDIEQLNKFQKRASASLTGTLKTVIRFKRVRSRAGARSSPPLSFGANSLDSASVREAPTHPAGSVSRSSSATVMTRSASHRHLIGPPEMVENIYDQGHRAGVGKLHPSSKALLLELRRNRAGTFESRGRLSDGGDESSEEVVGEVTEVDVVGDGDYSPALKLRRSGSRRGAAVGASALVAVALASTDASDAQRREQVGGGVDRDRRQRRASMEELIAETSSLGRSSSSRSLLAMPSFRMRRGSALGLLLGINEEGDGAAGSAKVEVERHQILHHLEKEQDRQRRVKQEERVDEDTKLFSQCAMKGRVEGLALEEMELRPHEFGRGLSKRLQMKPQAFAVSRLFHVFDTNNSGGVTLEEWKAGLLLITDGSREAHMRLVFDMHDPSKNKYIVMRDMHTMLTEVLGVDLWDAATFTEQILEAMGVKDDKVTYSAFKDACDLDPVLLECFAHGLPLKMLTDQQRLGCELRTVKQTFDWPKIWSVWKRMLGSTGNSSTTTITLPGFVAMMRHHFSADSDVDQTLMQRLFVAFGASYGDDSELEGLALKHLMRGFSLLFRSNIIEQAKFYFSVFDLDNDGFITREELYRIFAIRYAKKYGHTTHNLENVEADEKLALEVMQQVSLTLARLDINGDGVITEGEFVTVARRSPDTLLSFERCLFGDDALPDEIDTTNVTPPVTVAT